MEVADLEMVAEWLLCLSDDCRFLLHAHRGKEMVCNNGFTTAMSRGVVPTASFVQSIDPTASMTMVFPMPISFPKIPPRDRRGGAVNVETAKLER